MTITEVQIANDQVWQVRIRDDGCLQIVDHKGRSRHKSNGHAMTGVFLAMAIAERPFESDKNLDIALKQMAADFAEGK